MRQLLSERIKPKDVQEVFVYDDFSTQFRNQVFYIMCDILDKFPFYSNSYWNLIHNDFAREIGAKSLHLYNKNSCDNYGKINIEAFISSSDDKEFLDLVDFTFSIIHSDLRDEKVYYHIPNNFDDDVYEAIEELNSRFKQHNFGYEFINGEIIRIDNTHIHKEVIKPALQLLHYEEFRGAEEEFRKAFEYRRTNDNKNAILEAGKAFESTLKTICDKKNYKYEKKDTVKRLIAILEENKFYPLYMSSHISNLRITLESGLPTLRNNEAGHGQGNTIKDIPDEFTEYALNLAATNIVFLVNLYKG